MNTEWPGSIIHLQHDLQEDSIAMVPTIINMVREKGYSIVSLEECLYGAKAFPSAYTHTHTQPILDDRPQPLNPCCCLSRTRSGTDEPIAGLPDAGLQQRRLGRRPELCPLCLDLLDWLRHALRLWHLNTHALRRHTRRAGRRSLWRSRGARPV